MMYLLRNNKNILFKDIYYGKWKYKNEKKKKYKILLSLPIGISIIVGLNYKFKLYNNKYNEQLYNEKLFKYNILNTNIYKYNKFNENTLNDNILNKNGESIFNQSLKDIFKKTLYQILLNKNIYYCDHFHPLWRSEEKRPFEKKMENAILFSGSSNPQLSQNIADHLGTNLGRVNLKRFADGEVSMQFLDSIRGKDVYIIQPTCPPVNENLIELLLMISTCRRASAKKITAVIPYYGYARQDRKLSSRVPISAADVARMIEAMGVDRVVAIDLHSGQIQGFFGPRVPVDNLEAQLIGLVYFLEKKLYKPVIVSPDAGGVYRARKFQDGLNYRGIKDCGIAMLIKQRTRANEIEQMDLVGNVYDSDVIIVDDMIDTAGTLCEAAKELKKHGARRVFAFATHGLFSGPAIERIENSPLEEVVITDTVKSNKNIDNCKKITKLSVSVLVADAIRRIHQKESLNDLFNLKG